MPACAGVDPITYRHSVLDDVRTPSAARVGVCFAFAEVLRRLQGRTVWRDKLFGALRAPVRVLSLHRLSKVGVGRADDGLQPDILIRSLLLEGGLLSSLVDVVWQIQSKFSGTVELSFSTPTYSK
eukprot:1476488-Prymnesium_polylepis.1